MSAYYRCNLYARLIDSKMGLKSFIPKPTDWGQFLFGPSFIDDPVFDIRRAIPAHITSSTTSTVSFNKNIWTSGRKTLPLCLESTIALNEVVEAESRSPANIAATRITGSKLFQDRYLTIIEEDIAIGQNCGGALRISVDRIGWIGEMIDDLRSIGFVRWHRQLKH